MVTTPARCASWGVAKDDGPTEKFDRSRIGRMGAGQDLQKRRFARAVFAEQRVDLSRPDFKMHVFERQHAGKALADARHPEDRALGFAFCGPTQKPARSEGRS